MPGPCFRGPGIFFCGRRRISPVGASPSSARHGQSVLPDLVVDAEECNQRASLRRMHPRIRMDEATGTLPTQEVTRLKEVREIARTKIAREIPSSATLSA